MIEKRIEESLVAASKPANTTAKKAASSLLPPVLCTIAYVLCVLLMAAPLSRIPDPTIRLQLPFGAWLTQVGAWLPNNLGLTGNALASQSTTNMLEFLALVALSFVVYGLCALYISRLAAESRRYRQTRMLLWAGTVLAGLIFVFTPAMLSHDIFVYSSYSRLLANYHTNPYFVPLTTFPHDPFVPINHYANTVATYGPLWLAVCGVFGFLVGPQATAYVLAFRLFALAAHLLNIWLVMLSLRALGRSTRTVTLGALLYAWNPLVLLESGYGGHNDVFMMTFILLGTYLAARAQQRNTLTSPRGYLPPLLAFTLSALVKFTSLPVIVLYIIFLTLNTLRGSAATNAQARTQGMLQWKAVRTLVIAAGAAGVLALALYAPFWIGHSLHAIRISFTSPPSSLYSENSIMRALATWVYYQRPRANTLGYILMHVFITRSVWDDIDIALVGIACILSTVWLWRAPTVRTFILASLAALGTLLIVTPWFFSWYVTWLIGLAVLALPVTRSRIGRALLAFALAFSFSAFLTYLFLYGYPPFGAWTGFVFLTTITPPLLAFLITFITWRPAKILHLSASENVVP
ncbi:MAG TPA: hypothetical protein VKR83_06815 [Ktedonobacteraceae bacterium]|nr:hypothetical protein [Ktedonobacteraceae bacterium]